MGQQLQQSGHFGKAVLYTIRWDIQNNHGQVESAKVLLVRQVLVRCDKDFELRIGFALSPEAGHP